MGYGTIGDVSEHRTPTLPAPAGRATPVTGRLADATELARVAAVDAADGAVIEVGTHVGVFAEDAPYTATHCFAADKPGYRGWSWAVTVVAAPGEPADAVTVSEVVLLPGAEAITAPAWVPWNDRIRADDLAPGDVLGVDPDDERLVPAHAALDPATDPSDADQVRLVADELGLGRSRVMSPEGRLDAAVRWADGDFGPGADMARAATSPCGTCGFYLLLAGGLSGAFGVCGNAGVPADGRVVHVEYGCGGHSELQVDTGGAIAVADLVYDDGVEMEPATSSAAGGGD